MIPRALAVDVAGRARGVPHRLAELYRLRAPFGTEAGYGPVRLDEQVAARVTNRGAEPLVILLEFRWD